MKVSSFSLIVCLEVATAFSVNRGIRSSNVSSSVSSSVSVSSNSNINRLRLQVSTIDTDTTSTAESTPSIRPEEENDNANDTIRPLHQNWWPVSTVEALDSERPNAVQLLGMDLVLFQNDSGSSSDGSSEEQWTCLVDRCSHRFAPLSEGRVVKSSSCSDSDSSSSNNSKNHIECAYHGWRFDSNGACERIPQLEQSKDQKTKVRTNYCTVKSFPVRIDSGLVFVWADPETAALGQLIPLPTFPLLQQTVELKGSPSSSCYMRDLPYGYELLGENLLDLSHLPFSHHSVGNLKRELGGPLPFQMLSSTQKSPDHPLYEAILNDAHKTDPIFSGNPNTPKDASLNLGFYQPCHVRYTRKAAMDSYVALFFCPTSATRSRVFLFNIFGAPSTDADSNSEGASDGNDNSDTTPSKVEQIKNALKPSSIKTKLQKKILSLILTPVYVHQISHKIFDGDGIFLRMQGDRMQNQNLSYKDYRTPASADVLVNSFRRYTKIACDLTKEAGEEGMAEAACSEKGYGITLSREEMLDRYESHTKNCHVCSTALKAKEVKKGRIRFAKTVMTGGVGASAASLLVTLLLRSSEVVVPTAVVRATGKIFLGTIVASIGLTKVNEKNDEAIKQFMFEDYVHSEKD